MQNIIEKLKLLFGDDIKCNVPLAQLSQWKVGGNAKCLFEVTKKEHIQQFIKLMNESDCKYIVIGETTNLLFSDQGVDVPILKIGTKLSHVEFNGNLITCGAGIWVPKLARLSMLHSLTGIEHVVGIPGSLGGLVCMNGGSQRKGIGSHVKLVESVNAEGDIVRFKNEECDFSYRHSIFNGQKQIITSITLELNTGCKNKIRTEMLSILRSRGAKFPRKLPNCGSVFISNPKMYDEFGPPGKIIEMSGLKGKIYGGAQISPIHANFIVNNGNAKSSDILYLINLAATKVYQKTGYSLVAETIYIEPNGRFVPTHIKAKELWG